VLVPEFPSVTIDDHGSHTTTDYVEMTARLLVSVSSQYAIDPSHLYGTGQSMGCMMVLYLAAEHPDLFTAEYFVSGQWDVSVLGNLGKEKFFYIAAGGDQFASTGQTDVEGMLKTQGVAYNSATWDATWSAAQFSTAASEMFSGI
jgi:predicted peptidase